MCANQTREARPRAAQLRREISRVRTFDSARVSLALNYFETATAVVLTPRLLIRLEALQLSITTR